MIAEGADEEPPGSPSLEAAGAGGGDPAGPVDPPGGLQASRSERPVADRLRRALLCEVLPDPAGYLGFGLLALVLAGHLLAFPDGRGRVFGSLTSVLPAALRTPAGEVSVEALAQAFLLVGPVLALYAGVRHLRREGDSLLPFLTVAGGGLLAFITAVSLLLAVLGGTPSAGS